MTLILRDSRNLPMPVTVTHQGAFVVLTFTILPNPPTVLRMNPEQAAKLAAMLMEDA